MDRTVTQSMDTLEEVLRSFLKKKERVLLCFPENGSREGVILGDMVRRCGGVPVMWDPDLRWISLLKAGFSNRCGTVIGAPEIVLGLSKLSRRLGAPLYIRNALLVGEIPDEWLTETIEKALDCRIRGCCGSPAKTEDATVELLHRELRRWTTVLDFLLVRSGSGLSLEMIVFPGEKLPKLPSFARLVVHQWNPERDRPFHIPPEWNGAVFSSGNH